MRYAWEEGFLEGEELGRLARLALPRLLRRLRRQDLAGAASPDVFVANSRHVAERIARYYGRSAEIVHPPVDVEHFLALERDRGEALSGVRAGGPLQARRSRRGRVRAPWSSPRGRGRRQGAGGRPRRGGAGGEVEFLGRVDDAERDRLLSRARALLFPGEEDFGIVPVEAQAAGVPVIAYGVGGASESVLDGGTGVLFDARTPRRWRLRSSASSA